jgi:hypothetical protein
MLTDRFGIRSLAQLWQPSLQMCKCFHHERTTLATDTWQKRNGHWLCVASAATQVKSEKK